MPFADVNFSASMSAIHDALRLGSDVTVMSTSSLRCLLAMMPFVRASVMSTLLLRCLLGCDGSMATADVNFSSCDVCWRCTLGLDAHAEVNFSCFDACIRCLVGIGVHFSSDVCL